LPHTFVAQRNLTLVVAFVQSFRAVLVEEQKAEFAAIRAAQKKKENEDKLKKRLSGRRASVV
jgi:hypothetical protein